MKSLIKRVLLCFVVLFVAAQPLTAVSLSPGEVIMVNSLARFIDVEPEGQGLLQLQAAMRLKNPVVSGLASAVLFKHFGRKFQKAFLRSFTLNQSVSDYESSDPTVVRLADVNKLLAGYDQPLTVIRDERVHKLFMFYHFRFKNVWLIGDFKEKLSLAAFYRISFFEQTFPRKFDSIRLAAQCDR